MYDDDDDDDDDGIGCAYASHRAAKIVISDQYLALSRK